VEKEEGKNERYVGRKRKNAIGEEANGIF